MSVRCCPSRHRASTPPNVMSGKLGALATPSWAIVLLQREISERPSRPQPTPANPLPRALEYERASSGASPPRPGATSIGRRYDASPLSVTLNAPEIGPGLE